MNAEKMTPKYNIYECQNGHQTITRETVPGVTPFMIGCLVEGCIRMATSRFYPVFNPLVQPPTHEWVKPSKSELKRAKKRGCSHHYEQGGLLLQKINR